MAEGDKKATDLLGIAPYGEAIKVLAEGGVRTAENFLNRICGPAAEEFGLLLRDKVNAYRTRNIISIATKAEQKVNALRDSGDNKAHPRVVMEILDKGSWQDRDEVQELWAGLLASSCTPDGNDDSNLMFIDFLGRLTVSQCLVLKHLCETAEKHRSKTGLLAARQMHLAATEMNVIAGLTDLLRLDRELDHLCSLGLVLGGINFYSDSLCQVVPTPLGLSMYARCNGFVGNPAEYYGLSLPPE